VLRLVQFIKDEYSTESKADSFMTKELQYCEAFPWAVVEAVDARQQGKFTCYEKKHMTIGRAVLFVLPPWSYIWDSCQ
jgi:hypothetical protein